MRRREPIIKSVEEQKGGEHDKYDGEEKTG